MLSCCSSRHSLASAWMSIMGEGGVATASCYQPQRWQGHNEWERGRNGRAHTSRQHKASTAPAPKTNVCQAGRSGVVPRWQGLWQTRWWHYVELIAALNTGHRAGCYREACCCFTLVSPLDSLTYDRNNRISLCCRLQFEQLLMDGMKQVKLKEHWLIAWVKSKKKKQQKIE